jgi:tRNA (cmo5U34)-methyltransferase
MATRDETQPKGRWEFDEEVTDAFDDMLERSIPWYENMRAITTDLAASFLPQYGTAVDLGASRGEALDRLISKCGSDARYHAIEVSPPMLDVLRRRWPGGAVEVHDFDLRRGYPKILPVANVTLGVLTIQFIPIEHRQRILADICRHTTLGGAFIFVEKVLGATAEIDRRLVERYYALKGENGYSTQDIERKRLALEGVLVPVTAAWNEELLRQAGFREVDCFWRWANFAGWVAIR